MEFIELFLIAVGLSMDAFAVSLCKGLNMRKINYRHAAIISFFFGGFQAIMPLIGWALGKSFANYITAFDHWIAFALLVIIGGKMLLEGIKKDESEGDCGCDEALDVKELFILAIATSIDALAVGISFAFLQVSILPAAALIGVTTFGLSFAGVAIGNRFGAKFQNKAEIAGGVILILIGVKILLEHLGILG
jgi:putative Mn2+ efflux pump MntP